jgi:hypothetical protein
MFRRLCPWVIFFTGKVFLAGVVPRALTPAR